MPISIRTRLVDGKSWPSPVVICDHCGDEILDATKGLSAWKADEEGNSAEVSFLHTSCEADFFGAEKALWDQSPLKTMPGDIAYSIGIPLDTSAAYADQIVRCKVCTGLLLNYNDVF